MVAQKKLQIEKVLMSSEPVFFDKYSVMKNRLLSIEYEHWAAGFAEGNNHGRGHVERVLENLNNLVGARPLEHLDSYELFLAMMSILYHDIGLLRDRKNHAEISKSLLEDDRNDAYIVNSIDKEIIAAAVVSHSSSKDIGKEISRFSSEEVIGTHKARPGVIAALVRLADELDEDYRRADAILQKRLLLPPSSKFFWTFCQRVRGIRPSLLSKRIDVNMAFEPEDTTTFNVMPNGQHRLFMVLCAEKLGKINEERVKINRFLPPELQYSGLHIDVKPLREHPKWDAPRTFVFNDQTPYAMFLKSFPELWEDSADNSMEAIREIIRGGDLGSAHSQLGELAKVLLDLPARTQLDIRYLGACVDCLRASLEKKGSPEREELLDRTVEHLTSWFEEGKAGGFSATGRTPHSAVATLATDPDLAVVRSEKREALRNAIPTSYWPKVKKGGGGGGGSSCIPIGTLVETLSGTCPIERLRPGDHVVSLELEPEYRRIGKAITHVKSGQSDCCVLLNEKWLITPTQPIRIPSGWVEASQVKEGDSVMIGDGSFVAIAAKSVVEELFEVFDLSIEGPYHNFIAGGLVCHNKYKIQILDRGGPIL